MRVIIKSAWRWRKQKNLPNITFAFVDNQGIVGQRNVIRFLWFSIYYHTAASNKTFNRREFVRALMEASEQAKDHKSVDQDRWKCHLMRSLLIVQIRNDTSLNNFPSSSDTVVRYAAELFYMAPLYHLAFTNITNMVVIDATDLEFHDSLQILQGEMDQVWFSIL